MWEKIYICKNIYITIISLLMFGFLFQVLTTVPCVLVTPKRKLAGHLAVMKNVLHFFGEFLVEGTGGSSVFKNFQASSISDLTKPDQKRKTLKLPIYLDVVDSEEGTTIDNFEALNEYVLKKRQLKSIKRHRRWNIGKVENSLFHLIFAFYLLYRSEFSVFLFFSFVFPFGVS